MTPGPSSTPLAQPHTVGQQSADDALASADPSSSLSSSFQRFDPSGQPKTCAHCGQQLDSHHSSSTAAASSQAPSLPAPSPSSIAFAPDADLFHPDAQQQHQQSASLTSAINAAAAAALSRHLAATSAAPSAITTGSSSSSSNDLDAHAVCSRCAAAAAAAVSQRIEAGQRLETLAESQGGIVTEAEATASLAVHQQGHHPDDSEMQERTQEPLRPSPAAVTNHQVDAEGRPPALNSVITRQQARPHTQRSELQERRLPSESLFDDIPTPAPTDTAPSAVQSGSGPAPITVRRISASLTSSASATAVQAPSQTAAAPTLTLPSLGPASPPRRQAPWAAAPRSPPRPTTTAASSNPGTTLSITVGNMGAGGDAIDAPSANDLDFPPLSRSATSPTLRSSTSPGRSPTRERGRLRFMPGSPPNSSSRIPTPDEHGAGPAATTAISTMPYLARSGSFSRSLSYGGSGHDAGPSAATVAPVVSFPSASSTTQPVAHGVDSVGGIGALPTPPGRLRRSSSSSSGINVPAPAGAIPGGAKLRRPSVTRRLSRSSSSTAATAIPFTAVGTAAAASATTTAGTSDYAARFAIEEDPYGPASVTRPRLSTIPTHVISESLAVSGLSRGYVATPVSPSVFPSASRDASAAIKTLPNPLRFFYVEERDRMRAAAALEVSASASTSMDVYPPAAATAVAASPADRIRIDEARWYNPLRPDPLMELSWMRTPPRGRGCLFPGAVFNGTQKSGRNSYDVTVRIVNVDMEASHLCGYINIRGLTEDWPELTTYFDAEIIGDRHGFVTGKWGATEADDLKHWARFPPFRPLRSSLLKPALKFPHLNKPYVFMRWKERFLVPDHRVRDISGASFAGFYYVCVELGENATASRRSHVSSPDEGGFTSQWFAARNNQRRELSSGAGVWPPSPPPASAGVGMTFGATGMSPGKEREGEGREERATMEVDDSPTADKMLGFYFHENSEPYQQLLLHHVHDRSSAGFEMR